jgi:hypothetical protein
MNNSKLRMTAQIPSYVGMPSCGHVFGATAATATDDRRVLTESDVMWRTAGIGATQGADKRSTSINQSFPGTSAWRPPNC